MIDDSLRARVRLRARDYCEYCSLPQSAQPFARFHIDHIVAERTAVEMISQILPCAAPDAT